MLMSKEFRHSVLQTKIEQHFVADFSSNKSAPANRKTGFYANRDSSGSVFVSADGSWYRERM
jgi:hypothetical protein